MGKNNYVYAGYVEGRSLPEVSRAQAKKLTHLNIAFGIVKDDKISVDYMRHYLHYLKFIREYNPDLQILISTGGGGAGGHAEATVPEKLDAFVESTMDVVREFELDGIDCDWEFPRNQVQKQQHVNLMFAYRKALDEYAAKRGKKCWLTAAVDIGPVVDDVFLGNVDVKKVNEVLDFFNIMTYDFHCMEYRSGHHSAVYESKTEPVLSGCLKGVERYNQAGIPNDKMVLGAAFYAKQWQGVPDVNHGLNQASDWPNNYGPGSGRYDSIRSAFELNPDYIKYWDEDAQACWLYNGYQFITYEDPRALKAKCDFVKKMGLKGMMYWVHSHDGDRKLFDTIYDNLLLP